MYWLRWVACLYISRLAGFVDLAFHYVEFLSACGFARWCLVNHNDILKKVCGWRQCSARPDHRVPVLRTVWTFFAVQCILSDLPLQSRGCVSVFSFILFVSQARRNQLLQLFSFRFRRTLFFFCGGTATAFQDFVVVTGWCGGRGGPHWMSTGAPGESWCLRWLRTPTHPVTGLLDLLSL